MLIASFPFTEVKKQAEMANDLQTKHGRRLVHLYFVQWTEKTRQMQQAKDLHNRTVLKRFVATKNCVFTATHAPRFKPGPKKKDNFQSEAIE